MIVGVLVFPPAVPVVVVFFVVLIVFLGIFPAPMLDRIEPSVKALVAHVDEQVDDFTAVEIDYVGAAEEPEPGHGGEEGE